MTQTISNPTKWRIALLFCATILTILLFSSYSTVVFAKGPDPEQYCKIHAGTWHAVDETCTIEKENYLLRFKENKWLSFIRKWCGETSSTKVILKFSKAGEPYAKYCNANDSGKAISGTGRCKMKGLDASAPIGISHQVTATFKGYPAYLRLRSGNAFYTLPVIPSSITYEGGGLWSAQFYTADPTTGEALAPPGTYVARSFGPYGTAGGTATITLTR